MIDKEFLNQNQTQWQQAFLSTGDSGYQTENFSPGNWIESIHDWWKMQPGEVPESVASLYRKLLYSSRFFINFVEPFTTAEDKVVNPASILINYLEKFLETIDKTKELHADTKIPIKGFWTLPFNLWQQQSGLLPGFPESFFQLAEHEPGKKHIDPDFTRAYQLYLQALQDYQTAYISMSINAATELMQQFKDDHVTHLTTQQICELWIDLFEKYYAVFVASEEYSRLYAEVINKWMLLVQQTKQIITPWLTAMNMPVKNDVDELKAREKALLEENHALKIQLAAYRNKD